MNASDIYSTVKTTPLEDGADIVVSGCAGHRIVDFEANDDGSVTIRLRRRAVPRIGQRVKCGNRTIKVADRRWDKSGQLWLMDEDLRTWEKWS